MKHQSHLRTLTALLFLDQPWDWTCTKGTCWSSPKHNQIKTHIFHKAQWNDSIWLYLQAFVFPLMLQKYSLVFTYKYRGTKKILQTNVIACIARMNLAAALHGLKVDKHIHGSKFELWASIICLHAVFFFLLPSFPQWQRDVTERKHDTNRVLVVGGRGKPLMAN